MPVSSRVYTPSDVCAFRFTRAEWGPFSNFYRLPAAIRTSDPSISFPTSEHLYQAAKNPASAAYVRHILEAVQPHDAARRGRAHAPAHDDWDTIQINVMRWVLRRKYETNRSLMARELRLTGTRPIVEVSTRNPYWGAMPADGRLRGCNVLGRLWQELRAHLAAGDSAASSLAWQQDLSLGALTAPTH